MLDEETTGNCLQYIFVPFGKVVHFSSVSFKRERKGLSTDAISTDLLHQYLEYTYRPLLAAV
jgi:hypothetical protein